MGLTAQGQADLKSEAKQKGIKVYVTKVLTAQDEYFYWISSKFFMWFWIRLPKEKLPATTTKAYQEIKNKTIEKFKEKLLPYSDVHTFNGCSLDFVFANETKFNACLHSAEGSTDITSVNKADLQFKLEKEDFLFIRDAVKDIAPHDLWDCDRDKV